MQKGVHRLVSSREGVAAFAAAPVQDDPAFLRRALAVAATGTAKAQKVVDEYLQDLADAESEPRA